MKFIKGDNRTQITLFPVSLEQAIDEDNEVRIIDLFVDSLSLGNYGFKMEYVENGRPAYHPSDKTQNKPVKRDQLFTQNLNILF